MKKKQFKTESQKLLDMMINSIYTHKEIFLRELISNASDAIDKLYFRSLTDESVQLSRSDYAIWVRADKNSRTLTISDNGCGIANVEQARMPSFTTGELGERCGMGFLVMESFTDYLSVKSRPGKGTTVLMRKNLKP